jgi:hypothetical protein
MNPASKRKLKRDAKMLCNLGMVDKERSMDM